MLKLSVLICTLPNRIQFLNKLLEILSPQMTDEVELIYLGDNKKISVGEKRNKLIAIANGEYISFIDDDDIVAEDYVQEILNGIKLKPDVFCFGAYRHQDGKKDRAVEYSLKFLKDRNTPSLYERLPNHLMVWKKSIVCEFEHLNYGEDGLWAKKMKEIAKTQQRTKRILYQYYFDSKTTETQSFLK